MYLLEIAAPVPLFENFNYKFEKPAKKGARVHIRFGPRAIIGWVIACTPLKEQTFPYKIRAIEGLIDDEALLPPHLLSLIEWCHRYYCHPLGECLQSAVPKRIRSNAPLPFETLKTWHLLASAPQAMPQGVKSRQAWQFIQKQPNHASIEQNLKQAGISKDVLKRLSDKGYIECKTTTGLPSSPALVEVHPCIELPNLTLNEAQTNAIQQINAKSSFDKFLLYGVTGSGKTEVFIRTIHHVLQQNEKAHILVLVPEIGLTPQTIARFQSRFAVPVSAYHSGMSDLERHRLWLTLPNTPQHIIIGTRTSLFLPFTHLKFIIIDEEHDSSYKSLENLKFHARDAAMMYAKMLDIPIVMGSATPSSELLALSERGQCTTLMLPKSTAEFTPQIDLVDLTQDKGEFGLSKQATKAIDQTLERGEQALIFINRRGYSPSLLCRHCGWICPCPHCEAKMTFHMSPRHLHCHQCGHKSPVPQHCQSCGSIDMVPLGFGTQRIMEGLAHYWPNVPSIRIDRDTASTSKKLFNALAKIPDKGACLLVGTQMLAKGHHFPNLSLVVILDSDQGFLATDYRGPERAAQLLIQVMGRAGRAQLQGHVIIQSHQPDNPELRLAALQGYHDFMSAHLRHRKMAHWPPYHYLALIRTQGNKKDVAEKNSAAIVQVLQTHPYVTNQKVMIWGPTPAPMEKKQNLFHHQILIQATKRSWINQVCQSWVSKPSIKSSLSFKWSMDIDPIDLY